jgi:hypothetical protein
MEGDQPGFVVEQRAMKREVGFQLLESNYTPMSSLCLRFPVDRKNGERRSGVQKKWQESGQRTDVNPPCLRISLSDLLKGANQVFSRQGDSHIAEKNLLGIGCGLIVSPVQPEIRSHAGPLQGDAGKKTLGSRV